MYPQCCETRDLLLWFEILRNFLLRNTIVACNIMMKIRMHAHTHVRSISIVNCKSYKVDKTKI